MEWHTFEDRQSGFTTTRIRDLARQRGLTTDYSRIGWTTFVAVRCSDEQWQALLSEVGR